MLELFHFNHLTFILTFVIFITLLWILSVKVWKPVLKALDERDDAIRGDLDQAESAREEASKLLEEQQQAMANLREEGKRIREEAMRLAEKQKDELLEAARKEAERLVVEARQELAREKESVFEEIKALAVDIGVELAGKIISREMDAKSHQIVIDDSLTQLQIAYQKKAV